MFTGCVPSRAEIEPQFSKFCQCVKQNHLTCIDFCQLHQTFIKRLKSTMTWDKAKLDLIRRWDHCHPVWMWRHTVLSTGHYSFLRFIPMPCDSYGRCLKRDITFFQLHLKPANRVISEQETSVPPCAWVKKDRQNRRSFWGKRLLECCGTYSEILGSFIWPFVVEWLWNIVIRFLSVEV